MGFVHDIGKIAVPAEILSKPGKISPTEFNIIKIHPRTGYDILKDIEFPWPVAQAVLQHHERLDGSGYPSGLTGGDIIPEAKILAVADVVEAMASHRPYRPSLGIDQALEEITRNKGILYDPEMVDICVRLFREEGFTFE
jgi:HD-GYP domain-containing protein (c-di-GMP phosphodiesterase class II)